MPVDIGRDHFCPVIVALTKQAGMTCLNPIDQASLLMVEGRILSLPIQHIIPVNILALYLKWVHHQPSQGEDCQKGKVESLGGGVHEVPGFYRLRTSTMSLIVHLNRTLSDFSHDPKDR